MFNGMPLYLQILNTLALGIGYTAMLITLAFILRPVARGLSHGLWETVVMYKLACPMSRVFKRLARAFYFDMPLWGFLNTNTTQITNNLSGWYGIFGWHFKAKFNRADSLRERELMKAEAATPKPESEEEPFEWDDEK